MNNLFYTSSSAPYRSAGGGATRITAAGGGIATFSAIEDGLSRIVPSHAGVWALPLEVDAKISTAFALRVTQHSIAEANDGGCLPRQPKYPVLSKTSMPSVKLGFCRLQSTSTPHQHHHRKTATARIVVQRATSTDIPMNAALLHKSREGFIWCYPAW